MPLSRPASDFFGAHWDLESAHYQNVWLATQRRHLERQAYALMEAVEGILDVRRQAPTDTLLVRLDFLNDRLSYIRDFVEAVEQARSQR